MHFLYYVSNPRWGVVDPSGVWFFFYSDLNSWQFKSLCLTKMSFSITGVGYQKKKSYRKYRLRRCVPLIHIRFNTAHLGRTSHPCLSGILIFTAYERGGLIYIRSLLKKKYFNFFNRGFENLTHSRDKLKILLAEVAIPPYLPCIQDCFLLLW